MNQLPEDVWETGKKAASDLANETTHFVKNLAGDITDAGRDAMRDTRNTLETSKDYVRENPLPVVLAAIAIGAAVGYLLVTARRKPTFSERYADEPMVAMREAILGALAPVTSRVHEGYDSARDGAGKLVDRVHRFGRGRSVDSLSERIGRAGNNLKFW